MDGLGGNSWWTRTRTDRDVKLYLEQRRQESAPGRAKGRRRWLLLAAAAVLAMVVFAWGEVIGGGAYEGELVGSPSLRGGSEWMATVDLTGEAIEGEDVVEVVFDEQELTCQSDGQARPSELDAGDHVSFTRIGVTGPPEVHARNVIATCD